MAVAALSPEERQHIISLATAEGQKQGVTPQKALWDWAKANGVSPSDLDTYMGWGAGTATKWAVDNGEMAAPQGNSVDIGKTDTSVSAAAETPATPTYNLQQQAVIAEAERRAKANGTTPQEEAWSYAMGQSGNDAAKAAALIDGFFGWNAGTSMKWATDNGKVRAPTAGGRTGTAGTGGNNGTGTGDQGGSAFTGITPNRGSVGRSTGDLQPTGTIPYTRSTPRTASVPPTQQPFTSTVSANLRTRLAQAPATPRSASSYDVENYMERMRRLREGRTAAPAIPRRFNISGN